MSNEELERLRQSASRVLGREVSINEMNAGQQPANTDRDVHALTEEEVYLVDYFAHRDLSPFTSNLYNGFLRLTQRDLLSSIEGRNIGLIKSRLEDIRNLYRANNVPFPIYDPALGGQVVSPPSPTNNPESLTEDEHNLVMGFLLDRNTRLGDVHNDVLIESYRFSLSKALGDQNMVGVKSLLHDMKRLYDENSTPYPSPTQEYDDGTSSLIDEEVFLIHHFAYSGPTFYGSASSVSRLLDLQGELRLAIETLNIRLIRNILWRIRLFYNRENVDFPTFSSSPRIEEVIADFRRENDVEIVTTTSPLDEVPIASAVYEPLTRDSLHQMISKIFDDPEKTDEFLSPSNNPPSYVVPKGPNVNNREYSVSEALAFMQSLEQSVKVEFVTQWVNSLSVEQLPVVSIDEFTDSERQTIYYDLPRANNVILAKKRQVLRKMLLENTVPATLKTAPSHEIIARLEKMNGEYVGPPSQQEDLPKKSHTMNNLRLPEEKDRSETRLYLPSFLSFFKKYTMVFEKIPALAARYLVKEPNWVILNSLLLDKTNSNSIYLSALVSNKLLKVFYNKAENKPATFAEFCMNISSDGIWELIKTLPMDKAKKLQATGHVVLLDKSIYFKFMLDSEQYMPPATYIDVNTKFKRYFKKHTTDLLLNKYIFEANTENVQNEDLVTPIPNSLHLV